MLLGMSASERPPRRRRRARKEDPQNFLDNVYARYVVAPVMVLLGMIIVGTLIDSQLGTGKTFTVILVAAGGVSGIGLYFKRFWDHGDSD